MWVRQFFAVIACFWMGILQAQDVDPQFLAGMKARSIGPAGMSGRVTAIEGLTSDPKVLFVGAASGGVWKSMDGGLSFTPVFDRESVHSIGDLAVNQANPSLIWVGTGEGNVRNSVSVGQGVFKSIDGGKTWNHMGLEHTERINRIVLHPTNPQVAYVAALGRMWGENAERGVFRTSDGGRSWQKLLYVDEKTGCADLVMDPVNPDKLFASMWQYRRWPHFFKSGGPGSGLYVTHDGGAHWKRFQEEDGLPSGELGKIGLAIAPSDPSIVYALVEAEKSALLRSTNGGQSWQKVNRETNIAGRPFYFGKIRVDPERPNRVYRLETLVHLSEDGGRSFKPLEGARWPVIHVDYHAMWIDPSQPERIFLGNDGGIAESRDRGQSFRFIANLPLAQFYHIAVDHERPYNIYGGLQDNGSWRGPSMVYSDGGIRSHHWQMVSFGDGFDTLPFPLDAQTGFSMYQGGNIMRWDVRNGESKMVGPPPLESGEKLRFNWNAAMAFDPLDPKLLYYGSQFVHKTEDGGETWSRISPDLTTNNPEWQKQHESGGLTPDVTAAENYTTLLTIAPSPVKQGVIWVGSDDGRIHVTRDGGLSWQSVEGRIKGMPQYGWVPHIEASRFDAATAFVIVDHHRYSDWTPYVFRSDDYGKSWKNIAASGVRGYALAIEQDPVKKELLYLGTEWGLWLSLNGGGDWFQWRHGIPTASVMDLTVHSREHDLIVGTHGRGIFVLDDIRPFRSLSEKILAKPLHLFEPPPVQQYWRAPMRGFLAPGAGAYEGTNRPYGAMITFWANLADLPLPDKEKERERVQRRREKAADAGEVRPGEIRPKQAEEPVVMVRIEDAEGKTVRSMEQPLTRGINRFSWNLKRDPFKQPPRDGDDPFGDSGEGPEVAPGDYRMVLSYGDHRVTCSIEVLADPRPTRGSRDWPRRRAARERLGVLNDRVVEAIRGLARLEQDISLIEERIRHGVQDEPLPERRKVEDHPLLKMGKELSKTMADLEERLWIPPKSKGIPSNEEQDLMSRIRKATVILDSSWDRPSPSQLAYIEAAEKALTEFLPSLERLYRGDVRDYRDKVAEMKIEFLGR